MGKERDPAGPGQSLLVGHLVGFTRWMEEQGYSTSTVEQYRVIAGRFDNYLTIRKVDIACLNEGQVDAYLAQVEPRRPRGRKDLVADYYGHACRRLLEYLREIGAVPTPVKIDPCPAKLRDYLSFLRHHRALAEATIAEHEIWLLRFLEHLGVLTGHAWEAWAEVNPATARELGLHAGQRVRIESKAGAFETTIRIFSGAQPGVVNVPYGLHTHAQGWGEARGANPLVALCRRVDALSGLPDWYSTDVRVQAI